MEVNNLTFSYNQKKAHLDDINLHLTNGKITTIIGPNGSGKSTLLGVMCNHYLPQQGNVTIDGKQLGKYKPKELAKKLGVVHQENKAAADITVEKLVGYGRIPHKRLLAPLTEHDQQAIDEALTVTNLMGKRKLQIDQLSGGERQRVWIAMTLAQSTPYLFLDEPTTFLDIYYQYEVLDLVKRLNREQGLTIVMVLHDINQAIRYSDEIVVMKDGQIMEAGPAKKIVTGSLIKDIYGVEAIVKNDEDTGAYIVPIGL